MTPMFDEFDKELREALASEALPPDGFADRVMARVAETPQQKRTPSPARRWLLSATACLVVAAALIPLLRSGGLGSKNASDMAADTAGDGGMMMQSAPSPADWTTVRGRTASRKAACPIPTARRTAPMTTPWTERPTRAWSSPPRRPPWTTPLPAPPIP